MLADKLEEIQAALAQEGLDAWFFACFQHNDPVSMQLLGLGGDHLVTRRCYYLIPASGAPRKLAHALEPAMLDHLPGETAHYLTWQEHRERLGRLVSGHRRLAAQYSPHNQLPSVSRLDAGTAELLADAGCELATSAELVQRFAATLSPEQLESHRRASTALHAAVHVAFDRVRRALAAGEHIDEAAVQRLLLERFDTAGLTTESPPIVAVNAHSADPHYQPAAEGSERIRPGDFLLIDLWAKEKAPAAGGGSIYADITWTAVCAPSPEARHQEIFDIVIGARDAALALLAERLPGGTVHGYEVDDACRAVIAEAGYGERFYHRTGHSIDVNDHGQGANMDNLETHDTRRLIPVTCFSIEPGIYLEGDFGVRSEVNVVVTDAGAEVTGAAPQSELLRLMG